MGQIIQGITCARGQNMGRYFCGQSTARTHWAVSSCEQTLMLWASGATAALACLGTLGLLRFGGLGTQSGIP